VKKLLKAAISLLITVLMMGWAFRGTNLREQWQMLKEADLLPMLPFFITLLLIHVARTLRWGCLLSGMEKVPFKKLNEAAAIGFLMLIVLPFRLGEFARPFLIAQRSNIRRSPAMMTVVLERIVDAVVIAVLLRLLLLFTHTSAPELPLVKLGANLMFLVFGGGLVFLLFALWQMERASWLIRQTAGRISPALGERVVQVVETFVGALRQLPSAAQTVMFFLWTVIYWALNGIGMWYVTQAFHLHLSMYETFVVLCVLVVAMMIPAAPGNTGTYQAGIRVGLSLFLPVSMVTGPGLAFANALWFCQSAQQILLGLVFQASSGTSFSAVAHDLEAEGSLSP
jgi:uncharacterized protein (TIRG00374 family)